MLALFAVFGVFIFNQLVTLKHNVGKSWSNIDIPLKQRHDELPKLVETCKQYMQFEQETLEKVMPSRSQVASVRASHDIPRWARPKAHCGWGWATCLRWPRPTPI